jgi:V8-like Glu-specific endopeptidase
MKTLIALAAVPTLSACDVLTIPEWVEGAAYRTDPDSRVVSPSDGGIPSEAPAFVSHTDPIYVALNNGLRCNGFYIGNGKVLTAAHCLDGNATTADLSLASSGSTFRGRVDGANPAWVRFRGDPGAQVGLDVGRIDIGRAIPSSSPNFLSRDVFQGEALTMHAYSEGEGRIKKSCDVLGQSGSSIEIDCYVKPGWSGAPLTIQRNGQTYIAGMVSGRGSGDTAGITVVTHARLLSYMSTAAFLE